jgi:uncharacterized protein YfbU (UPF0304 family)
VTAANWIPWISLVFSVGTPLAIFIGRNWLKARIEKGVQHGFDRQMEEMRAEFRKSEERLKSTLRDRESEITTLRNTVLAGSAGRQALLDKRRFEAVERVWTAVNDMAQLKSLSEFMAILNIKYVSKKVDDPKMQRILEVIGTATLGTGTPDVGELKEVARDERPFLPDLAWAYFSAYSSILHGNLMLYNALRIGVGGPEAYLTMDSTKKILKAVLPHQTEWIDQNKSERYHNLLDEVEENLLAELRKILDGRESDQATTERARGILNTLNMVDLEQVQKAAADITDN